MAQSASERLISEFVEVFLKELRAKLTPALLDAVATTVKANAQLGSKQIETIGALTSQIVAANNATGSAERLVLQASAALDSLMRAETEHRQSRDANAERLELCRAALATLPDELKTRMKETAQQLTENFRQSWLDEMKQVHESWRVLRAEVTQEHAAVVQGKADLLAARSELANIRLELSQSRQELQAMAQLSREIATSLQRGTKRLAVQRELQRAQKALLAAEGLQGKRPKRRASIDRAPTTSGPTKDK